MAESTHPTPSDILNTAILFATEAHRGAFRKGTGIPYILHPLEAELGETLAWQEYRGLVEGTFGGEGDEDHGVMASAGTVGSEV